MEDIINNIVVLGILIVAGVVIWKVSKTVISMVIGFVILVGVAIGVWYVYKIGLADVASDSGYFIIFIKGIEILIGQLRDVIFK